MEAISIQNLSKTYPGVQALKKVNFKVEKGRVHGFLGPNGAGKTTTMKIISGLIKATSGKVEVFGQDIEKNLPFVKSIVGFLPEYPPLYLDMVVKDYLEFVAAIHNVPRKKIPGEVREVMEKIGLTEIQKRLIGNLSKGYQQRVGLAQALVFSPKILILDEPTSGLDPASMVEIRKLIDSLKGEEVTILLSTHHLEEVTRCCSDITIINRGEIIVSDTLEKVQGAASGRQVITAEVGEFQEGLLPSLRDFSFVEKVRVEETENQNKKLIIHINEKKDQRAFIGKVLVEKGCELLSLSRQDRSLEEVFLNLTQEAKGENI